VNRDELLAILRAHCPDISALGVTKLALFGSFARDEASPDSDVDLVVEFDAPPTFSGYMDAKFFLEDLLGRQVDLVPREGLKPRLRPIVEREEIRVA
jgi:uncharacterized protein